MVDLNGSEILMQDEGIHEDLWDQDIRCVEYSCVFGRPGYNNKKTLS